MAAIDGVRLSEGIVVWDGAADGTSGGIPLLQAVPTGQPEEEEERLVTKGTAWRRPETCGREQTATAGTSTASCLQCHTWTGTQRKELWFCLELSSFRKQK